MTEIKEKDAETERVIIQDCVRTFSMIDHQKRLERFLNGCYIEFGNYSQGMAHVAALLMLTLPENGVIPILRRVNSAYIPGHWEHEAEGFATNAYVLRYVAESHGPSSAVVKHLNKLNLLPEMWAGKWFKQVFVHSLDVEHWYPFFERFLQHGFPYLIACGVSALASLSDRLLACADISPLLKMLALYQDIGISGRQGRDIVDNAVQLLPFVRDALGDEAALKALRERLYNEFLRERMEAAAAAKAAADEECDECDCPFHDGGECGKPAKWSMEGDGEYDGTLICADCKKCAREHGYELSIWD